ncbi:MAG: hypothetical protein KDA87_09020, partial [Planctomycetales bacterium]|nr:hypothetical protein [Planctomycetales bacterium]
RFGDTFRFLVDTDNDGVPNIDSVNSHANGLPVAGRFDNNDANGDEVAIFDGRNWYIDTDHDFKTDYTLRSFLVGYPIVGDFDGDGFDDLATWTDDTFRIDLANGVRRGWDGKQDVALWFGYIGVRERPVAADMDQDGFDDLGLWVPDREGVTDRDQSEWYFLVSNGNSLLDRLSPPDDPIDEKPTIDFTPVPFGPDMYIRFGDEFALPIVGNFDPPTLPSTTNSGLPKNYTNAVRPMDVNNDSLVTAIDALLVINELNGLGARELTDERSDLSMIDVNDDGYVSPIDALVVLNYLNSLSLGEAEGVVDELPEGEFDHGSDVFDQVFANRTASRSSDSASLGILPEVELQTIAAATSSRWDAPSVEVASVFAADGWNKLLGQRKSVFLDDAFEDEENWLV